VRTRPLVCWLGIALAAAGVAVYLNSLSGAFVNDDLRWIVGERDIRSLSNWSRLIADTPRPILKLSLALNYAAGELDVTGYHLVNVSIHVLAGLVLFGVVRRTLAQGGLVRGRSSIWLAFCIALIWLVHPLQTQAVTYLIQRGESLMGLFYLSTLYCAIRFAQGGGRWGWGVAAVTACGLGLGTKEVMITAPLVVLLYDRTFLAGSFRRAIRERWGLHGALWSVWGLVLLGWIGLHTLLRGEFARPDLPTLSRVEYALTQPAVLLQYLRLVFWPHPLCFDYNWPAARSAAEILPPALVVGALLIGTAWALARGWWIGFVGAWFFIILAPTSSVVPIQDLAVEHRMYLALAAPVALAVIGVHRALSPAGAARPAIASGLVFLVVVSLSVATVRRNRDYRSHLALRQSVVLAAPDNPRGHYNIGTLLKAAGRVEEAMEAYERAIELDPGYAMAHYNLANALLSRGENDEAIAHYQAALASEPQHLGAAVNLGNALRAVGRPQEAILRYREALNLAPRDARAHYNLAVVLQEQGQVEDAIVHYQRALEARPSDPKIHNNLGSALAASGRLDEAIEHYRAALDVEPNHAKAHFNLGGAYEARGDFERAIAHYRRALEIEPDYEKARERLAAVRDR
jgi:tetratricopeptide (TPR) repeat protein